MPRIIETTVYQYDELSEAAQAKARDAYRNTGETWMDADEYWQAAQEFSKIAPLDITAADYYRGEVDIEWTGVWYASRFDHDECIEELSGLRAWKWLQNNDWFTFAARNKAGECTMTGTWCDGPFGDAIMEYADKPLHIPDIKQVFYEAAQEWVQSARRGFEYSYSDEAVIEAIEANEYEFTADGEWHV